MNGETPIEIEHLPARLHADFDGRLPAVQTGTAEEKETNFLSRALAAFAVHRLSGCTLDEAANSVVDGGGDGGIDAIYYSPITHTLWIVQSKYMKTGRGEPELGDASKFRDGLDNLLQGRFEAFERNEAWKRRLPDIQGHFADRSLRVRAIMVYSGIHLVSEDRLHLFEDIKRRVSPGDEYFLYTHYNLTSIHDWLTGADEGPGVKEVELTISKPGWVPEPYETIYGLVSLADINALYAKHGVQLVAANIRHYKGATEVNERILDTIRTEPQHLLYLNNGLTAFCERLEVNNLDRGNAELKRLKAFGFSIVNGAQTLGSIQTAFAANPNPAPNGVVFLRIVSLERCVDEVEFARRITESTNFQNQIGSRDFVALDDQQERIARQLQLSGIAYSYKDAAEVPPQDAVNFSLDEATTALACLEQESECDICARVLANRRSLWSFEIVYPDTDLYRSRYEKLFRPDRSARTVWRTVQVQRLVLERMRQNARAATGIRRAFFENVRWLVLNLILLKLHPEQGNDLALSAAEIGAINAKTDEFAEVIWALSEAQGLVGRRAGVLAGAEPYEQARHFRSVFCSPADCQRLRNATLAKLAADEAAARAQPAAAAQPPPPAQPQASP